MSRKISIAEVFSYVPDGIFTSFFFYLICLNNADKVEIDWKSESISLRLEKPAGAKSANYFAIYSIYLFGLFCSALAPYPPCTSP